MRVCFLALVVSLVAAVAAGQQPPALVTVGRVVRREVATGQTFVGTVLPLRSSRVGGTLEGFVVEFPVNEGDRVEQGGTLAKLRTETLEIQRDAARASLEELAQELAEIENGPRPEEIEQARAKLLAAKATLEYRRSRLQRARELAQGGRISTEELQEAESVGEAAEQEHQVAKLALDLALAGSRKEKVLWARARRKVQEEEVRRIEDLIRQHTVVAPFGGYVVAEHTELGQWLGRGDAVVELAELDSVDVQVFVPEEHIARIELGASARVDVEAVPDRVFTAKVALVVPQAQVRARSFPVKVRLENPRAGPSVLLKPGMFARVTLAVGRKEAALMVPKDALVLGGPVPVVFVVDLDGAAPTKGKVRPVPVQLGMADGDEVEAKGALKEGESVVTEGNERLFPGQEVEVARRTAGVPRNGGSRPEGR